MLTALAILSALASIAACVLVWGIRNKLGGSGDAVTAAELQSLREKVGAGEGVMRDEFARNRKEAAELAQAQREELRNNLAAVEKKLEDNAKAQQDVLRQQFDDLLKQLHNQGKTSLEAVKDVRETIEKQLKEIREDNGKRLEEMRKTVDEKLQDTLEKRLGESFKQVSERLEQVHKGLGEMQSIASGVGDLKKVLTNVKTKGILGEYQLANIIEQLLPREQYEENVATRPGSTERVEFAIRMPGNSDDDVVWLPIDSKFPLNGYEELLNAREAGDLDAISSAEKALTATLEKFAKDISEKYVEAPHTTDFGVMFLPIESLYAEVLRHPGVFETLQRKYRITVTGPTTMSALLNSLQMGFRTLAVTKRSSEVWKILEAVKTEFGKFSNQLEKVDKQLSTAKKSLEDLRSTRTNVMQRRLKDVGTLDTRESESLLDISAASVEPDEEE
ncbi:MAG: DNA recombination protein RmuC [Crocinitomicaceae bacterium TMED45]|nr:MAG: DNA recombination protein RmuC [Crocinitomicaceae bacterium TMED45]|tara:strand:+ start:4981 stop:6321 length:1341 start_codon:yes stop_codon:yes gene_type:complete